jgi:DNA replication protein DnaC
MLLEKYGYSFPAPIGEWKQKTGTVCPICDDNPTQVDSKGNWIYCVCKMEEWLDQHKNDCQLFETPVQATSLDTLKPFGEAKGAKDLAELIAYVRKWVQRPREWMWIEGTRGTGKTHILCAIKTMLPQIAFYIGAERFASECFRTLNHSAITEDGDEVTLDDFITRLSTVPILLFDDWGLEHKSTFVEDQLAAVINNRYRFPDEFPVIMTSNYELGVLANSPDLTYARIASRMSDPANVRWFKLRQADYRLPTTHGDTYASK